MLDARDAVSMVSEAGVDGAWVARGAIGNPWVFRDAIKLLNDPSDPIPPPTVFEQRDALTEHFAEAMAIHGESLAGRRMRKMGIKYARFHPDAAAVKSRFIAVRSLGDWSGVLAEFYATDAPGVRPPRESADETSCG